MKLTHLRVSPYLFFICIACCLWFQLLINTAYAADIKIIGNTLVVTPKRCVALRQGQVCYQEVTFSWQQAEVGNYCLVELSTLHPLQCWSQATAGEYSFDFQSASSLTYVLRKDQELTDIAAVNITVSWVFESSKRPKSSWKLF